MTFPWAEGLLAMMAVLASLVLVTVSLEPWLAAELWDLAIGMACLWLGWRGFLLERRWQAYRAWRHNVPWQITPDALGQLDRDKAPGDMTLGLAFPWTAAHTQQLETALATLKALPTATDRQGGCPALHVVGQRQERPLTLTARERGQHVILTSLTGGGKTELLESLAREAIHAPGAVMVLDLKFGRKFLARCAAEAHKAGKPFAVFLPPFPSASVRFNVLATAQDPGEVCERIRALMPSAGGRAADPFFEEFPLGIVENIAQAQQILGIPWTLPGLFRATMIQTHLSRLIARYLTSLGVQAKERKIGSLIKAYRASRLENMLADSLIEDFEWPGEHKRKVTATLIPTFRGVIRPPLAPLLGSVQPDLTWHDISDRSMVVYAGLASLRYRTTAHRIGRALIQDFLGFLGHRHAYTDCTAATPITLMIDELRQVLYPGVVDALAMTRSAGGSLILAQQSMADAVYALGKAGADVLMDNVNTQIWGRCGLGRKDSSAAQAVEGLGTCRVQIPKPHSPGITYGGVGGLTGNTRRQIDTPDVPLLRAEWMGALPIGHFVVRGDRGVQKLRAPLLTPVRATEMAALGLTAIWEAAPTVAAEAVEEATPDADEAEAGAVPALKDDEDIEEMLCDEE